MYHQIHCIFYYTCSKLYLIIFKAINFVLKLEIFYLFCVNRSFSDMKYQYTIHKLDTINLVIKVLYCTCPN